MNNDVYSDLNDEKEYWIPNIDCQYTVYWQSEGEIYAETFSVFEYDDEHQVFKIMMAFAKEHEAMTIYREPDYTYFNPKTGEEVKTPHLGSGIDHYDMQGFCKHAGFTAVETDELPF